MLANATRSQRLHRAFVFLPQTVVPIGNLEIPPVILVVFVVALPLALVAAVLTRRQRRPPRCMQRIYVLGAFVASVAWIDVVCGEVVALLQTVGYVFDVPAALLGQTALAWGNSFGDIFANVALARRGRAKMAITGCFAAPTFNTLCVSFHAIRYDSRFAWG
eukprot:SAG11_NODE_680_length_7781_cov_6.490497_5_plen_162_part_00